MNSHSQLLPSEQDTLALGAKVARCLEEGIVIYLFGQLGTGKTTFVRGLLRGLGYKEKVKSPTYTLVEPYEAAGYQLFHCDFYRLNQADEVQHLGILEHLGTQAICIIEWPEKGFPFLPEPDVAIYFELSGEARTIYFEVRTVRGQHLLRKLAIG